MIPLLMGIVGAQGPTRVKRVLDSRRSMNRIRRFVVRIDQCSRLSGTQATPASRALIHSLKGRSPSTLRQVVIEQSEAGPPDSFAAVSRRIRQPQARPDLLAVITRHALDERNSQALQRQVGRILGLTASGRREQAEGGLIAQSVVQRDMRRDSP